MNKNEKYPDILDLINKLKLDKKNNPENSLPLLDFKPDDSGQFKFNKEQDFSSQNQQELNFDPFEMFNQNSDVDSSEMQGVNSTAQPNIKQNFDGMTQNDVITQLLIGDEAELEISTEYLVDSENNIRKKLREEISGVIMTPEGLRRVKEKMVYTLEDGESVDGDISVCMSCHRNVKSHHISRCSYCNTTYCLMCKTSPSKYCSFKCWFLGLFFGE